MEDLISAIDDHSHYDPDAHAEWSNDNFWETLYEKHGAEYRAQTEHPSFSDFQIWADDRDLVPEEDYEND